MESSTKEEPVTPAGRLFLRPEMNQIINCAIGFKHPLNIQAIKAELSNSLMIQHPRFSSLLVVDKQGREYWRKTHINLDDHIIIHQDNNSDDDDTERIINGYLADFAVSSPLSTDKPLWEIHILHGFKCGILRIHHALGDGVSLMSLFLASCTRYDDDGGGEKSRENKEKRRVEKNRGFFWTVLKVVWFTIVSVMEFIGRSLWIKDEKTVISGGDGVELWPRMVATAKFSLDDMKAVKCAIPNATINDVLFGIVSYGLSRYLESRSSSYVLKDGLQITGLAMVNLRRQPKLEEIFKLMEDGSGSRWGNQFGMILLPVYYHTKHTNPLDYVRRAKAMIDKKKQSLEAHFSYMIGNFLMSCFGPKVASMLNYRIVCNTSFTISNIVGPQERLAFASNPITYIRVTSSSLPHAITMHMLSYAGKADMQILVAKDIIPNPQFLAKCFQDALLEMKNIAEDVI